MAVAEGVHSKSDPSPPTALIPGTKQIAVKAFTHFFMVKKDSSQETLGLATHVQHYGTNHFLGHAGGLLYEDSVYASCVVRLKNMDLMVHPSYQRPLYRLAFFM